MGYHMRNDRYRPRGIFSWLLRTVWTFILTILLIYGIIGTMQPVRAASTIQGKLIIDAEHGLAVKKDKALYDVTTGKKITPSTKDVYKTDYGILVLKTNGSLYYFYQKSGGGWGHQKLASGVSELARTAYIRIENNYHLYFVKTNGRLVRATLTFNTDRTKVTKKTFKTIMAKVAHAYVACEYNEDMGDVSYYALKTNGDLYGWGQNTYGQVGNGKTREVAKPVRVLRKVAAFQWVYQSYGTSPKGAASCYAIKTNGDLYGWGINDFYTVKMGAGDAVKKPIKLMSNVKMVDGDSHVAIALTKSGELWTWGTEVGNNTTEGMTVYHTPIDQTKIATDVIAADVNMFTIYYVKKNHYLYYKGYAPANGYKASSTPKKLTTKVNDVITTSVNGTYVLKTNGYLYGCGMTFKGSYAEKLKKLGTGYIK